MLTINQMDKNKDEFIRLLFHEVSISRKGVDDLVQWLLYETDFFSAPASTRFHGDYEGGLCEHSLNVYVELKRLEALYEFNVKEDTLVLCALLHDVCKANFYKKGFRNVKDKKGNWTIVDVWEVEDKFPLGHGEKSCLLIQRFIALEENEMLAIRWHMGGFDNAVKGGDYSLNKAQDICPLVTLLHMADLAATNLIENREN